MVLRLLFAPLRSFVFGYVVCSQGNGYRLCAPAPESTHLSLLSDCQLPLPNITQARLPWTFPSHLILQYIFPVAKAASWQAPRLPHPFHHQALWILPSPMCFHLSFDPFVTAFTWAGHHHFPEMEPNHLFIVLLLAAHRASRMVFLN